MTDSFAEPQTDYDAAENSDVLASGMFDGWELLVVLVPTATLACPTVPEVFPMGLIDRVVVAVEPDYFNSRIDEAYPIACREAAAEGRRIHLGHAVGEQDFGGHAVPLWRRIRRRSNSLVPPHTPWSRFDCANAYSRHSSMTEAYHRSAPLRLFTVNSTSCWIEFTPLDQNKPGPGRLFWIERYFNL